MWRSGLTYGFFAKSSVFLKSNSLSIYALGRLFKPHDHGVTRSCWLRLCVLEITSLKMVSGDVKHHVYLLIFEEGSSIFIPLHSPGMSNIQAERVPGCAFKKYISFNPSTFNAMRFDENPFRYQCKWQRLIKSFRFRTFMDRLQVTSWQWSG